LLSLRQFGNGKPKVRFEPSDRERNSEVTDGMASKGPFYSRDEPGRIANLHIIMCAVLALLMAGGDALASVKRGTLPPTRNAVSATPLVVAGRNAAGDVERLRKAVELAHRHDWTSLRALTKSHGGVDDVLRWLIVSAETSGASFDERDGFLHSHPDWPRQGTIQSLAEKQMPRALGAPAVLAWFAGREPETGIGAVRLGEAEMKLGKQQAGSARIKQAWLAASFDRASELEVLAAHGALLPLEVQDARLARLLYGSDEEAIRRQLPRASHGAVQKATLRRLLQKNPKQGLAQYAASALKNDAGVMFDAARAMRPLGRTEEARRLLLGVARSDDPAIPRLRVWSEIVLDAGDAMREHAYRDAYELVSLHHLEPGTEFADAEFLAGWIALTYLSKPDLALKHFQSLEKNVSRPISVARAEYWTGRAFDALKKKGEARAHYAIAARKPETFYGQLALTRIEAHPVLRLASEPPMPAAQHPWAKDERAQAFRILAAAGARDLARDFALRMAGDELTTAKAAALIAMANEAGDHVLALKIAKHAEYQDVIVTDALNPTAIAGLPEPSDALSIPKADLLALVRQESEFDPAAVSTAGARGLMQLMPAAAKERAKTLGLPYSLSRLTSDAQYNVKLGTTHFRAFFEAWRGSYVLAIASYNAGAGNVRKWIKTYGDPRDPAIDVVDWIEAIPFAETRNYVQRVIENIEVYRSRLAGGSQSLDILNTLDHSGGVAPLASVAAEKPVVVTEKPVRHPSHRTAKARRTRTAFNER
jgi:soluble lytic murein transglycosylase